MLPAPGLIGTCGTCFRRYLIRPDGMVREHYAKPFATDGSKCTGGEHPPIAASLVIHLIDPDPQWSARKSLTLCCEVPPVSLPAWDRYSNDKNVATCAGKRQVSA